MTREVLSGAGELVMLCTGSGVLGWEHCWGGDPRECLAVGEILDRGPQDLQAGEGCVLAGAALPRGLAPRQSPLHCAYPPLAPSRFPSLRPCDGCLLPCPRLPSWALTMLWPPLVCSLGPLGLPQLPCNSCCFSVLGAWGSEPSQSVLGGLLCPLEARDLRSCPPLA